MMTLDEMKLAVCEKLPVLIKVIESDMDIGAERELWWITSNNGQGCITTRKINWPTEGLQVCHEAEKLLNKNQWNKYTVTLAKVIAGAPMTSKASGNRVSVPTSVLLSATYEQRLEALTRVWFPKRFE